MKNIHVIPTDKPSRLYSYKYIDLYLHSEIVDANSANLNCKNQNIYITSEEEIKDGDWMIRGNEQPTLVTPNFFWDFGVRYYKIILTTDKDLIGVQAIDDEFLEWFVKNPSCEDVELANSLVRISSFDWRTDYKIIIPKEEPKQLDIKELNKLDDIEIEEMSNDWGTISKQKESKQEFPQFGTKEFNTFFSDLCDKNLGGKPKQYSKYLSCCRSKEECSCKEEPSTKLHKGEVVDESYPKEFKQETLEEVKDLAYYRANAEEDYLQVPISVLRYISELEERSYSEQETFNMLMEFWKEERPEFKTNPVCVSNWFEQNKKK